MHWHIDRLTVDAVETAVLAVMDGNECQLVSQLIDSEGFTVAVLGFGCTDCRSCESHLLVAVS